MADQLLAAGEIARRAGVSVRTVERWAAKGLLTPVRIVAPGCCRGVVRYSSAEVDSVLRGGR